MPVIARQPATRTVLVLFTIVAFLSTILAPLATRAMDPDPSSSPAAEASASAEPSTEPSTEPSEPAPSEPSPSEPSADPAPAYSPSGPPSIVSDLEDYPPGGLVTLTGTNWQAGESVHIFVNDDAGSTWSRNVDVEADATGNIHDEFNLPSWFVAEYTVKATGSVSGLVVYRFTDSNPQSLSVASPTSRTVTAGSTANYGNLTITKGGNDNLCTINLAVAPGVGTGLPSGATLSPTSAN
ncbi:MAG TPA: hypothetical protein VFK61_07180, partial [Candidatus Limnocylindria bacterium]|nr:hypothetical protein [Candidatus Limnocylindria bacterium]